MLRSSTRDITIYLKNKEINHDEADKNYVVSNANNQEKSLWKPVTLGGCENNTNGYQNAFPTLSAFFRDTQQLFNQ